MFGKFLARVSGNVASFVWLRAHNNGSGKCELQLKLDRTEF